MSKKPQLNAFREKLHAIRSRLDARAPELRDEAFHGAGGESTGDLSNAPIHQADRAGQETEATVNLGLAENEAALRRQVEEALLRFEDGTFGICAECQAPIDAERLTAVPYASLCIRCAKRTQ
jgi:RNA polymerase-binding protein DksA